jgi:hypothetical protein
MVGAGLRGRTCPETQSVKRADNNTSSFPHVGAQMKKIKFMEVTNNFEME